MAESLYGDVASILEQLLLPRRLILRAAEDLHQIAEAALGLANLARHADSVTDWMNDTASSLRSIRDQAEGIRTTIEPMGQDLRVLRDEFGRANDEIARLREAFGPELEALRSSADGLHHELKQLRGLVAELQTDVGRLGDGVTTEMAALHQAVSRLVKDADEISDVVEPLQAATDRVGSLADRLPGGKRRG